MKSFTSWQDSQQLKATAQRLPKRNSSIGVKLNSIWQTAIAYLATTSEPHVWTSQRSAGGGSGASRVGGSPDLRRERVAEVPSVVATPVELACGCVEQAQEATGHTQWNAYDPVTRQFAHFASAQEMRVWLEERHYQYHLAAQ